MLNLTAFKQKIPYKKWYFLPSVVVGFIVVIAVLSYLTNPFTRFTAVKSPFHTEIESNGQIQLIQDFPITVRSGRLYGYFAWLKSAYHIIGNVYAGGTPAKSSQLDDIIRDIHQLRFNPDNDYLISGDHFSTLFPRSLGIFYHSVMDPRTALDETDWSNRQRLYLQTTAFTLATYQNSDKLSTTIVPVGPHSVYLQNIYQPPSDTLYSMLYALDVMSDTTAIETTYPFPSQNHFPLQTNVAAEKLLNQYRPSLNRQLNYYLKNVRDPDTGLIRKDILLSGTKDIAMRQSAFYDNVILWKTQQLAQKLNLDTTNVQNLDELHQKILSSFWSPTSGCFLEDLSPEAKDKQLYSSDWLIVLSTQFLDPHKAEDQKYYEGCVNYIQKNKLDQPFGLLYQTEMRKNREYLSVRLFAPAYGTTTIWSNWGMEYVKLLVLLSESTNNQAYLKTAQQQITAYSNNIVKYKCYPEVYDDKGNMYHNAIYKSVCQTGWVVSYEQARKMIETAPLATPSAQPTSSLQTKRGLL